MLERQQGASTPAAVAASACNCTNNTAVALPVSIEQFQPGCMLRVRAPERVHIEDT